MFFIKVKDKNEVIDFEDMSCDNPIESVQMRGSNYLHHSIEESISEYQRFLVCRYQEKFEGIERSEIFEQATFEVWDYLKYEKVLDLDRKKHNFEALSIAFYNEYPEPHRFLVSSYVNDNLDKHHILIHGERAYLDAIRELKPIYQSLDISDWCGYHLFDRKMFFSESVLLSEDQLVLLKMSLPEDMTLIIVDLKDEVNDLKGFEEKIGVKISDFS